VVLKQEKIRCSRLKRAKERPSCLPELQDRQAYGDTFKENKEAIHGLLKLLQRVQGIIPPATKGHALRDKNSLCPLYVAPDSVSIFQKTKMDKTVRQHQLPQQKA
jgi:hypothetical protein